MLGSGENGDINPKPYERAGLSWHRVALPRAKSNSSIPLTISLEEDSNTPPRIFVTSPKDGRKALLFRPEPPVLTPEVRKGSDITWKATDGHEVTGGLYLPPDYEAKTYPLVIQTHGFEKDRFWIDGPWSSAFAAQPLAARDIVVLQVGSSLTQARTENTRTRQARRLGKWPHMKARWTPRRSRLIDRRRVGIIGFSRTVSYVAYTLTHSKYQFAAATLADGFDAGYVNLMLFGGVDYIAANGGLPFGPPWILG